MYYIDGLSYEEIASFLSIPKTTVKGRLQMGRRRLKEELIAMVEDILKRNRLDDRFSEEVQQARRKLEECMERMRIIGNALKAYETEKGDLPNWLSDLVPNYLNDPKLLICPAKKGGKEDIRLPCSYVYTFRPESWIPFDPYYNVEWEKAKLKYYGGIVPILSCEHFTLNRKLFLSYDGEIYEAVNWENTPQALTGILTHIKDSLLSDPKDWWSHCGRNFVSNLSLYERLDELIPILQEVIQVDPKNGWAYKLLGEAYAAKDEPDKAFSMYQKAAAYLPDDIDSWIKSELWGELGNLAHQLGRYEESIQAYDKALELSSYPNRGLYARLATVYADIGESEKVEETARRFLQDVGFYQMESSIGAIYQAGKEYERAIECYCHTIEQSLKEEKETKIELRTRGVVERRLVECYLQTGRKEEAEALQARLTDISPTVIEPDAFEEADYLLRLRWVEAPATAEVKGDAIIADGSEPDDEFIAKLSQTLPGVQLRLGVTLPLKMGRKISVLLPYDFEPYHAFGLEVQLGRHQEGDEISLEIRHHREHEGIKRGGFGGSWHSSPPGSTHLLLKQVLTLDDDTETHWGAWPVREEIGKSGYHHCPITEMHPNAFRFENRLPGERGFYLFLTILEGKEGFFVQYPPIPNFNRLAASFTSPTSLTDVDALRKAIEQTPLDRKLYCELAALYAEMDESEKVAALADEFAMAYARHTERGGLGDIYKAGREYEKGVEAYQRVLALRPAHRMTDVQLSLAECLEQLGRLGEAEKIRRSLPEKSARLLGKPAPDFSLRDTTGKRHRLSDYKGQVVLLNFISIPCGVMQVIPHIERLHRKYKSKGVIVLGLTKEPDLIRVQEFIHGRISYPVLIDAGEVIEAYGAAGQPNIRIIDKTGILRHAKIYEREIEQKLKELLAEA
jgi:tetratricopeptide (TPR) repeat protein/predicted DNA-binding protein YlxM (UPF0122 family)